MKRTRSKWAALALAPALMMTGSVLAPVAGAHHAFSMFDKERKVSLKGVVRKIEWTNPHVYLLVEVTDAKGSAVQLYTLEGGSVNKMQRKGWKPNTLQVGEAVSFSFHPLRNGQNGGLLESITKPSGETFPG